MSLLKRLWLRVFAVMLVALCASLLLHVMSARDYLRQQLYAQSADGAASLALSMSQQRGDPAMAELLVSALFDSGHFERIVFRDVNGAVKVARETGAPSPDVPAWFRNAASLEGAPGTALVTDGWRQLGGVEVTASARYAYRALWQGALRQALMLLVMGVALCVLLVLLLRWAAHPLKAIVSQASAIGQRRFELLPELSVPELRVVGRAMNGMVARVQAMFAEQAARIETLRTEVGRDPLTQLANRGFFLGSLRETLGDEEAAAGGVLIVVRVLDLLGLNRRIGRERTDTLIQTCAGLLSKQLPTDLPGALAGRLNGAEFGILLPGQGQAEAEAVCRQLLEGFDRLYRQEYADREPVAALAWTTYRHGEAPADVLLRVDAALMRAETSQPPLASANTEQVALAPVRAEVWRDRLQEALGARSFELAFFPVVRANGAMLHEEGMLRLVDADGKRLSAGLFMPAAIRQGLSARLDLHAVELALERLASSGGEVAVNLSPHSVDTPDFLVALRALLAGAPDLAQRLWVELSERGIGDVNRLGELSALLLEHRARLGVEHFGWQFAAMPRLHALSVDYLKLDGSFVDGIEHNDGNQRFVRAVVDVAASLDISVIAERVASEAEWRTLTGLGVAGLTGPAVTARAAN
ncbi:MAG: hypothetical protein CGU29_16400 [Candidatus Dactylopiibacterium carminicum]|uniref:GGDEF domain-containing protein n=1 Tax=Candidatus Dactylopiibacterium carminicum TaxID=857335 RepID=A0A272EMW8_9RHOO|nr:EAL domain-containing protein [Candidatus Dactylopiibacterium carminicum]KAF7597853.1 hypothetical protein BGI27_16445 [Candidatus Dactylopiibacterium carminicum]PAS91442.1 MAG: hypothetical protein CGU29_16400 [Candidatus Dactylopiibacterium carminicum]PAS95749.1 MAG: hypothetical protein BSR46_16485 [Candidatus Dactylopiibacterium carminicum]